MNNKVIILNFSGRPGGNCAAIAARLKFHHAEAEVNSYIIDHQFGSCGGCDYECLRREVHCPRRTDIQLEIMDSISNADVVYYIVPNFCGYPCANYFAFNERCVGYFNGNRELMQKYMSVKKKFIIVSNTETAAFESAMKQQTSGNPDMLYLKTGKYKKQSIAGDLMESHEAVAELLSFVDGN